MSIQTIKFSEYFDKLNPEQKKAVETIEGPVLVLAGPGTGKTQVLTMRIGNILQKTDTDPDAILALTFTESGVRAMRERLIKLVGEAAYRVNIYTFHSFASEVIQSNPDEFLTNGVIEALSDLERVYIFKEIVDELSLKDIKPFSAPYFYLPTIISKIKELKREGVSADEFLEICNSQSPTKEYKEYEVAKSIELALVYKSYSEKLIKYKRYDFEDMINFVVEKFSHNIDFLARYQERFQYFLVDEFQDTNNAQSKLLYLLNSHWGQNSNIFVVGDDDQSIYRFQGASTENIKDFLDKYPNSAIINLEKNYRSKQFVLDAAYSLVQNNQNRIGNIIGISKNLRSVYAEDELSDKIHSLSFTSSQAESFFVAQEIKKIVNEQNINPGGIAIIYRNNADVELLSELLSKLGIKYQVQGGQNVLQNGLIVRLMHLFNVIYKIRNKDEDLDVFTLLNYEFLHMDPLDVLKLYRFASQKQQNIFECLDDKGLESVQIKCADKFIGLKTKLIGWNYDSVNLTFIDFFLKVLEESGYMKWILDSSDNYRKLNILNSFLTEIKRLNSTDKELTLETFIQHIELMNENRISVSEQEIDFDDSSVHLMTAHKSKGLEYSHVFIPYFIDKKWSNVKTRDLIKYPPNLYNSIICRDNPITNPVIEDERRLVFVALTRSKNSLYITNSSKQNSVQGSTKESVPSQFLSEIDRKFINEISETKLFNQNTEILKMILSKPELRSEISHDESVFLHHVLNNFKLSATALNTYLSCNYKFKLDILLKTPRAREKQLILGSAVHSTLEYMYKAISKNGSIDLGLIPAKFKDILDKEIIRKSEYQEIYDQGIFILNRYIDLYRDEINNHTDYILFLEKYFGFDFNLPILDNNILLQGKIDKIILTDDKNKLVKIVDYKTGRPKTRNQILGNTKDSEGDLYRQLLFYKLLIDLNRETKFEVSEMMLDFIGDRKSDPVRVNFESPSDDEINKLKDEIRSTWSGIHELKFERIADFKNCYKCKYNKHCWPDGIPNIEDSE